MPEPNVERPSLAPYYGLMTRRVQAARVAAVERWLRGAGAVLDVGCGLSDLPARLAPYVGCDRNPVVLAEMRRRHPGVPFLEWDVAASPPPEELRRRAPFSRVLMLALLEHLSDPAAALARVASLLGEDGRLVVTTPHPRGRLALEAGARLGLLSRHADEEHEDLVSPRALAAAAASAGLAVAASGTFLLGLNQWAVLARR